MSNDLGSDPLQTGIVLGLLILHGAFVLINTALEEEGKNTEKLGSTNKLIVILCSVLGGWFAFTGWAEIVIYFVLLIAFGQFFPRKIALQHSESIAEKTESLDKFIALILTPVTWTLMLMANILLRIFRQETIVDDEEFSEEEVMSMLEVGQETGIIKEEGKKMINSIFAFDDKLAYEVMTPRTDVFLIDIEDPLEEYLEDLMTLRHSRIPVCEGETDNIIGILNIKDYLRKVHEAGGEEDIDIKPILRKAYFVPETKNIDTLFFELQKTKQQIAILIDEYGGFSGIVTMEDIIEQVMGNIEDEYDEEEEIIDKVDDNIYLVDGDVSLDDLNEEMGIELISESSETIGGFIIDILGEIPDESDEGRIVEFENYQFKIMAIRERRIERVKIYVLDPEAKESDENEQSSIVTL